MTEPNLNTFAPISIVPSQRKRELPILKKGSKVVIAGAGAFGGWSALYLLRKGYDVTLVDPWGGGNSRSSSGDETRVIRSTYGSNETYFDMNVRALQLWKEHEKIFARKVFYNTGVLWFCYEASTPLVDESLPFADKHDAHYEYLSKSDLGNRYPLINTNDLHHGYLDPHGGYLKARESVMALQETFIREGGTFIQERLIPGTIKRSMDKITLEHGGDLKGDLYLFACGSWMGQLFPEILGQVITCSKQEVYYLGTPIDNAIAYENLPVWVDVDGKDFYYGIPGNASRGFKIGVDIRGEPFNPTAGDHSLTTGTLQKACAFITHRFPGLRDAPLLEHRVCPYENSPDGNFIFDVHPEAENVVFLGGGSGHGFKHGPALGELVSQVLSGEKKSPSIFSLSKHE